MLSGPDARQRHSQSPRCQQHFDILNHIIVTVVFRFSVFYIETQVISAHDATEPVTARVS